MMLKTLRPILAAAAALGAALPAYAQNDVVRTDAANVSGRITGMTPEFVTVTRGSSETKVLVGKIKSVQFGDEPSELRRARVAYRNGDYTEALKRLAEIDKESLRNPYAVEEVGFFSAACAVKLALLGEGSLADAGRQLDAWLRRDPKGFRWLAGTELMGDLFVAIKRYKNAEERYNQVGKARWPGAKIRAAVLLGEVSQAQDKHDEALRRFDQALAVQDDSAESADQKLRAQLGRAVSLAATSKLDEGVALVEKVIVDADPESRWLNATAYNALGSCYRQAGRAKDATFAYLHVDLLYPSVPEAHAEALYHLGALFGQIGKPQQAREAKQQLKARYPKSPWAKR